MILKLLASHIYLPREEAALYLPKCTRYRTGFRERSFCVMESAERRRDELLRSKFD